MLNTTYHSNIYTLPIFKTIRKMLEDIKDELANGKPEVELGKPEDESANKDIQLANGELFQFNIKLSGNDISLRGVTKSQKKETQNNEFHNHMLSYKQLNNQDLVLITEYEIFIYTIVENSLMFRYFWSNEKWYKYYSNENIDDFKILLQEILDNEFKDSLTSLPSPNFTWLIENYQVNKYKNLIKYIINDPIEFSKFGSKLLEIAIRENRKDVIQSIFDKIIELVEKEDYGIALLPIISIKLPDLIDQHYSDLVMKYILHTSILLDPLFSSIKNTTNTSLYAYSKDIHIKKSTLSNNYVKSLFLSFYKLLSHYIKRQEETPTISFIVPFPQICNYQDKDKLVLEYDRYGNVNVVSKSKVIDYNPWNKFLYVQKSLLFCNVDSENFYNWWNFAAIVDFKWKTFGKSYYYLIWFFYAIFYLCFILASTLDITDFYQKILFIITILLGLIHLSFEIQQCLWKQKVYFKDPWNLFGK